MWFTESALPTLDKGYPIGDETVHTRRPQILVHLSPQKYAENYINAKVNAGMICPSWYVSPLTEYIAAANEERWRDIVQMNPSEVTGPEDNRTVTTSLEDHIQKLMIKHSCSCLALPRRKWYLQAMCPLK
ncbi:unnamed protein product [Aspergillus oryzae RIB40]|uniref:DNA, SC001 n=1 Tax=Aspergillus oryzae (strain ATCC 42149 / RIB 40) TaxID=510516 RepID=Q2UMW3_ASPOR|nr:unnamed protein product [Aspergillus oryzae RIB40]BAE57102.1 unnamed protein product [Aspergillus oryzae RIB40]